MPTVPSSPDWLAPHHARAMAESFGIDPERYDRTRPEYPQAVIERIVVRSPGCECLDVGCGTGIAARQFQAAGCRVLGVDVDPRMAAFARSRGLEVEVARFEDWDPAGRRFDTLIAAMTWHWIDPIVGAMKAAEVLNGGGQIAVFRNEAQLPTELAEAFAEVYDRVLPDLPLNPHRPRRQRHAPTRTLSEEAVHGLRQTGRFEAEDVWTVEWQRPYTREQWLDELPTSGLLTRVRPPALAELLTGIAAAIDATTGGSFIVPYTTVAVTARRKI